MTLAIADDSEEGWVVDEEICTDGGTDLGFLDATNPHPRDNSLRLYTVNDSHITRPLVRLNSPAVGFYALSGQSVIQFSMSQTKEQRTDL